MVEQSELLKLLAIWPAIFTVLLWGQRKSGTGAGLVLSYAIQLTLLHWLGTAIYALPWYEPIDRTGMLGLEQSTIAMAGFTVGSVVLLPKLLHRRSAPRFNPDVVAPADPWIVRVYLIAGALGFFVIQPFLRPIPTIGALASAMSNLLLVALGLGCWNGLQSRGAQRRSFWHWILITASLPFITILSQGFLGYGFAAMLTIFAFVASFYRPRWKLLVWGAAVGFLALSVYVTYMRDRKEIRSVVWGREAYSTRVATTMDSFENFELFDPRNRNHLRMIDVRLNQNLIIGMAVEYLQLRPEEFANGRTIWEAVLSPIPRLLWPNKPIVAGSGELVTEFTGHQLNTSGTSIGIGHVMEWYVNFGSEGVFYGMVIIGMTVGWLDRIATERLFRGDLSSFALTWLPGLSLLQVGGSLVEAVSSAAAGFAVAVLVNRFRSRDRAVGVRIRRRPRVKSSKDAYASVNG